MTVVFRDEFSGYSAPATSGAAPFTATDNVEQFIFLDNFGSPTTGDQVDYTLTFPTGTVTFRARWSSTTTLLLERVSTIPGTSNGTATLQTFTSTSTSKPRTDGDVIRMSVIVNRGAVNALTALTFRWHARSNFASAAQTTNTFNVDGELTPTAASFAITGTSFRNRPSLDGRSPDTTGGGTYTWARSYGSNKQSGATVLEQFDVNGVVAENDLQPVRAADVVPTDIMYGIAGGMSLDALTVRLMATIVSGEVPLLNIGAKWDAVAKTGLIAWLESASIVHLGTYTAGVYDGDYDSASVAALDDDTPHLIEVVIDDVSATAQVLIDTVAVFSPAVDISAGSASLIGPGGAGIGMWRSDRTIAGISVSEFEVEDAGVVAPPTDAYLVSQHEFYSDRPAVIGEVVTDSYPFSGTIIKHPESATDVSQDGSQGAIVGAGRVIYLDSGIQYSCEGVTVPLGDDYCSDVVASFPRRTTPGSGTAPFNEPWRYKIIISPGSPSVIEGLVSDLIGFDGVIASGDGSLTFRDLTVWPNGQPKSFEMLWNGPGTGGSAFDFHFYTTGTNPDATGTDYPLTVNWEVDEGGIEVNGPYPSPPFYTFSGFGMRYTINGAGSSPPMIPMSPQNLGPDHYYPPFYFPLGNPATDSRTIRRSDAVVVFDLMVTSGGGSDTNVTVHEISELQYNNVSYAEGSSPSTDDGDEYAEVEALVRYDELTDTGYGLRFIFDHTTYPSDPDASCVLFERDNGVETRLLPVFDASPGFHEGVQIRLCVAGTILSASFPGGSDIGTFDYATDDADETSAPVDAHDTGDPGFGGSADQPGDLRFEQFNVYEPAGCGDEPPEPPCTCATCPPVNGNPPYPPPPPPTLYGFWIKRDQRYRFVHLPDDVDPTSDVAPKANLARRPAQLVMPKANMAYRTLAANPYPGDTTYYPPGPEPKFDPCLLLPPIVIPPGEEIGPPPARLFFSWNIGGAQLGPLWTACFRAMGASIRSEITAAASHGGAIYGTPGDKGKFMRGGAYAEDLMLAWIAGLADIPGFVTFILDAQDAGSFAGVHAADDWENAFLWPPYALSMTQLNHIGQYWKAYFTDGSRTIRVFIRARSGQLTGELPSLDGLISQMRMTGREWDEAGQNAATYAEIELDYCYARNWRLHLSQNFFHGPGSVSAIMSPADILDNATRWNEVIAAHPHGHAVDGEGGWEYDSPIIATSYFPVLAQWRNQLEALGAPS